MRLLVKGSVLDITGGRKLMAVAAAIEALSKPVDIVAAIIPDTEYARVRSARDLCGKTAAGKALLLKLA